MLVVGIYLGIQALNIVLNATGLDLGPITSVLDFVINNTASVIGILAVAVVAIYLYNRMHPK